MPDSDNKREKIIGITVVALAIVFLVLVIVSLGFKKASQGPGPKSEKPFIPQELITGTIIETELDLSLFEGPHEVEQVIQYESTENYWDLVNKFELYFKEHGWEIIGNRSLDEVYLLVADHKATGVRINIDMSPRTPGETLDNNSSLLVAIIYSKI